MRFAYHANIYLKLDLYIPPTKTKQQNTQVMHVCMYVCMQLHYGQISII